MQFSLIVLASLLVSVSALATPHHNVHMNRRHANIAKARAPTPEPAGPIVEVVKRDGIVKRCKPRVPTSSLAVGNGIGNVVVAPSTAAESSEVTSSSSSSSTKTQTKTTSTAVVVPTTTKPAPTTSTKTTTTKTKTSAQPTSTGGSSSGGSSSGDLGQFSGNMKGQGTWYDTGLTACGVTNSNSDFIAAVSHLMFDSFPGATANPNLNPICNKKVSATYQGKTITVSITDRCTGCAVGDLDFTPTAFQQFAPLGAGRLFNVTWHFL